MNETKEEISNRKEVNVDPEVVSKDEVKERINDWWGTTVLDTIESEWFRIQKVENHIEIIPVDVEKKKDQGKKEAIEKPKLYVAKLGNIKYISTEKGVEFLKELQDRFDSMDRSEKQKQEFRKAELLKRSNDELQNAENRIQVTAEMKNLTFYDGVILTWDVFNRLINGLFFDDETEKEDRYKKWIDERASDILINNVINPFNVQRAKQLHGLFEIHHSQYIP